MSSSDTTSIVRPLSPSAMETSIPEHDPEATLLEMEDMGHDMAPDEDTLAIFLEMGNMVQAMAQEEETQAIHLEMEDTARDIVPEQELGVLLLQMEDMVQDMSDMLLEAATMQETKVMQPDSPVAVLIPPGSMGGIKLIECCKSFLDAAIGFQKTGADT
ncbi:hypothetical protein KXV95_002718 [Aspergillus fumigatus]|nr:hypothetical protein KXX59_003619 [Aspergillus fumigatus]KAH1922843.1 hypothetical protein KXW69_001894 [Aspergillus fumigatus]KAH2068645.1 hypothetical protein KXX03_009643 [Aspergillus fumigatus]KAH2117668.1 hypothetical protein KXV46_001934 [Aspergillus fumigatus]KAH2210443.1 hypothetical protein KXW59_005085 [Aspergillus fumigatus]